MKRSLIYYTCCFLLALISSIYLYQVASEHENINDLGSFPYYPIIVIIILSLNMFSIFTTEKQCNRMILTSSVLIIGIIIAFEFFKPDYTFQEAESHVHEKFDVPIIDNSHKVIFTYGITVQKNDRFIKYSFDPYSGELYEIETD